MREILFRGKRKDNGEWVTGFYVHYDDTKDNHKDDCDYIVGIHTGEHFPFFEVIPETVGQFTGLTDKNGKKIFEGDIVDILDENEEIGVIKWADDDAMFTINSDGWYTSFNIYWSIDLEVIGNIHDNPEILEGGEENG